MTEDEVLAAIRTRFTAQWSALGHSSIPVIWPNEATDVPATGPYAHAEVVFGAESRIGGQGGIGNNIWRQTGEVVIRLFTQSVASTGSGESVMGPLVRDAAKALRGFIDNDLKFYGAGAQGPGDLNGNLYQRDVVARFTFDLVG